MTRTEAVSAPAGEQSRARYPDETGYVERDGVRVFWEQYGDGEPAILFLPTWSIVHSRAWKAQIPYFARYTRVLTFDPRGNGRSDRPLEPAAYDEAQFAADALAVMGATGTQKAVLVGLSLGSHRGLLLAGEHPERVSGICFIGAGNFVGDVLPTPVRCIMTFDEPRESYEGWDRFSRRGWERDFPGFLQFFFGQVFVEAHSTKQSEDCVGWALETTPEALTASIHGEAVTDRTAELCAGLRCPLLLVVGSDDRITPPAISRALASATGARLVVFEGSGHSPHSRDPVRVNLELRDFARLGRQRSQTWQRAPDRGRRALYVSSPIGLGHAWRDVAIARELRKLMPDLQIDWLAQDPVTRVLEAEGERIHPASAQLASEATHIDSESRDHELNAFETYRRMDEILLANFMLFHDVVEQEPYDLWIGDEAWELDYFLHENPECKRAAYVWLTDFVGWLPMIEGGEREALLTADYNAEMIEQIDRYPRVRDRAIFIGNPEDVVPHRFGPTLPSIREWAEEHFTFAGHVLGFDRASSDGERNAVRAELGYGEDERVCIVSAGGSGVGEHLLRRVIDAHAIAAKRVPGLRTVVVAGPRIAAEVLRHPTGVEVIGYVHDLQRHLAVCDLAVVHGGLATTMELTAARRPFLYFPLKQHFEQQLHVRHRLERYRAGRYMDIDTSPPDVIADAIADQIDRDAHYEPVETDGARRAAALIAELL
jgi:pimeloyl-ACP methyl ester carboxylesterase/predicted glycosyltransferase